MDKLKMQTKSKVDINVETIEGLFPNTVTEVIKGYDENNNPIIEKAIDFEILKQELSKVIVEGKEERYQMNWPGKKEAILKANSPINMTLRPCREESVDFDKTENLYIEGDNLEVLKLLQETYLNKVKMIYIDPPYNTGNDTFVYNDDFTMDNGEFSEASGQFDEDGNIKYDIRKNNESNGRFHTDWLNMMYPRLKLAKDLLKDDGVMFISIDDNEIENMLKICKELFGSNNIVATLVWEKKKKGAFLDNNKTNIKEYIIVVVKEITKFSGLIGEVNEAEETYPCIKTTNARGIRCIPAGITSTYKEKNIKIQAGTRISSGNMELIILDDMIIENGILKNEIRIDSNWIYGQDSINNFAQKGEMYLTQDLYLRRRVSDAREKRLKDILFRVGENNKTSKRFILSKNLYEDGWGTNEDGNEELHEILGVQNLFDFPKPTKLIAKLLYSVNDTDAIILDFFAGSSTTADAIMQLNAQDNGNRKFIMVQLAENFDKIVEKSDSKTKKTIKDCIKFLNEIEKSHLLTEIGKERIRRAGKKIKEENPDKAKDLDVGFRVLKLDSSNMKDVFYNPAEFNQTLLNNVKENIKEDRSSEDLLFQVMLDLGELLSSDIEEIEIQGNKVFNVGQGNIVACFDKNITNEVVAEIAKMNPFYAVFRDSSLSDDAVATNFEQIFKTYSPNTIRKVL